MVGLTCGSAEFALVSLPVAEYPALPEPPPAAGTMDGGVLAVAAAQVVPAASRDDTLPMLTAVCLDIDGETLTLAATDRYRMAVRDVRWEPAARRPQGGRHGPGPDAGGRGEDHVGRGAGDRGVRGGRTGYPRGAAEAAPARDPRPADGVISFEGGNRRLTARLIGGEFIRYRSRFPAEFGSRATVPAGPFTEAVRRVSLVAERASPVRLAFGSGNVVIEAQTDGRARAVETVPADFEGDERVISFSPHYLLDGLAAAAAQAAPARQRGRASRR